MLTDELRRFLRENALIAPGDRVTCAVSGGADSMCLLWALYKLRDALRIELSCAHYNHCMRDSANRDEAFVLAFCEQHGILHQPEDCFQYLRAFPERFRQVSLFDDFRA